MDKKEIIIIVIKVLIYALGLIAAALGVSALTSCAAAQHIYKSEGRTLIVTNDTTVIHHDGSLAIKIK